MCGAGCAPNWVNPDSGTPGCGHAATRHAMYIWSFLINSKRGNTGLQGTGDGTNVATFDSNLSFEKCIFLPHTPSFQSWAAYCSHPGFEKNVFSWKYCCNSTFHFFRNIEEGGAGAKGELLPPALQGESKCVKDGCQCIVATIVPATVAADLIMAAFLQR